MKINKHEGKIHLPTTIVYGEAGAGKTTLASNLTNPLFILLEDGLGVNEVDATELISDWDEFRNTLSEVFKLTKEEGFNYKTIVIDSLSALEKIMQKHYLEPLKFDSVSAVGFGRGYDDMKAYYLKFISMINALKQAGLQVVCLGHSEKKLYVNPDGDDFDHFTLAMHNSFAKMLIEHFDCVFYLTNQTRLKSDKKATMIKNKVLYTGNRASCLCKNRLGLDQDEISTEKFKELLS